MSKKEVKLHPALLLFILTIIIMIVSSVGSILHLETTYFNVNAVSGDLETKVVTINNLFNRTGLQYLVSNMLTNFINFAPLGTLILGLMGVGVAYKSGFLNSFFKLITKDKPKKLFTFLVVFLGVISSMFYDAAYVILIPIAAILFIVQISLFAIIIDTRGYNKLLSAIKFSNLFTSTIPNPSIGAYSILYPFCPRY